MDERLLFLMYRAVGLEMCFQVFVSGWITLWVSKFNLNSFVFVHGKKRWWSLRSVFSIGVSGNEDAEEEKHCGGYLELNTQADGSTYVGIYVPKAKVQALLSFIIFLVVFHAVLR